ncbi:MAG: rhodanese-like domain-containing protein [Candidatus Velthaea sp.]
MTELSVHEFEKKRAAGDDLVLLDVREPYEVAVASLPAATLIPMMEIPQRFTELPRDKHIVVMCHHGVRSETVAAFLEANGYTSVANLTGGINAWSEKIDGTVPRY